MSPAGLKGVAEEVGLEMVVVCGNNMGDIFRRNAFNLGLHVVQSPEAVADAQDGDEFTFDPGHARARQRDARQDLHAGAAHAQGGRDPPHRRHLRDRPARVPPQRRDASRSIAWPDAATARKLTTTEQIVWAHRVDKDAEVRPGATLRVYADLLPAERRHGAVRDPHVQPDHRRAGHLAAADRDRERPLRVHRRRRGRQADRPSAARSPRVHGIEKPYYATPGDGIFHFYFPRAGAGLSRA